MPRMVNETLYYWIIRSALLFIKVQSDRNDQIVLEDHCQFITRILRVILNSNIRTLYQNFTIDLRNFNNFQVTEGDVDNLEELGITVTEESISDNREIIEISKVFASFLESAPSLETFAPGISVYSFVFEIYFSQPKMSYQFLCFREDFILGNILEGIFSC